MKPILSVMIGISGSGKSTYAQGLKTSLDSQLIETDDIREELTGNSEDQTRNREVFHIAKKRIKDILDQGKNAIIDATSVSVKSRKDWIDIGKESNAEIRAYFIDTPVDIAKIRNQKRKRKVPTEVIDRQASMLECPTKNEGFDSVTII